MFCLGGIVYGGLRLRAGDRRRGGRALLACSFIFIVIAVCKIGWLYSFLAVNTIVLAWLFTLGRTTKRIWLRPLTCVCCGNSILLTIITVVFHVAGNTDGRESLKTAELAKVHACGYVLGISLQSNVDGQVLVLLDANLNEVRKARFLDGFRKGIDRESVMVFTEDIAVGLTPSQPVTGEDSAAAMEEAMKARYLRGDVGGETLANRLRTALALHPECGLVVSMVPIPDSVFEYVLDQRSSDDEPPKPRFAMVNANGPHHAQRLETGLIVATIQNRSDPVVHSLAQQPSQDPTEIFEQNYSLDVSLN